MVKFIDRVINCFIYRLMFWIVLNNVKVWIVEFIVCDGIV